MSDIVKIIKDLVIRLSNSDVKEKIVNKIII